MPWSRPSEARLADPSRSRSGLLEGIRILDLTMHLSGPYGSMLLADMGAEVLKVEPPSGDPQRLLEPSKHDVPVIWASINRNKQSLVLDLRSDAGHALFLDLVRESDVVYANFRPGVLDRLRLSHEHLLQVNPGIVLANLTGYGADGPRANAPAYDIAIQALAGGMSLTGHAGSEPARAGIPIADLCGGMLLSLAVLAALHRRDATGEGMELDVSLFETQISMLMYWAGMAMNTGVDPPPQGSGNSQVYPYGAFPTADGHVVIAPYSGSFWSKLCGAIGAPELVHDARFVDNDARLVHKHELRPLLEARLATRTTAEWIDVLQANDVPCAQVNTVGQAMADPQTIARGLRIELPIDGELFRFAGNPVRTRGPMPTSYSPPPRLGQHTEEVLQRVLGLEPAQLAALRSAGAFGDDPELGTRWRPRKTVLAADAAMPAPDR